MQASSITPHGDVTRKAVLALEDGRVFWGKGLGAFGQTLGEVCVNTSMTGYQEILTDPSYAAKSLRSPSRISGTSARTTKTSSLVCPRVVASCCARTRPPPPTGGHRIRSTDG
jgi:carbamoyl-phosphate synthase small subunit